MRFPRGEKRPIALVDTGHGPHWVGDTERYWENDNGGRCPKSPTDIVLEYRDVTRDEWDDLLNGIAAEEWAAEVERVREGVLAQCNGEMMDLRDIDGNVVASVPKIPFICYALDRTSLRDKMPAWKCVAHQGMKMGYDCPYHSDWYYGAGFDDGPYNYDRESPIHEAAGHEMARIQREYGGFKCAVLVTGPYVWGVIGRDVALFRNLHADNLETMLRSKAVITEVGGALAHLSNVAREQNIPIVLIPNARETFKKGMTVSISTETGEVEIQPFQLDLDGCDEDE